ncbi:hypothetical protein A374_13865 [Fictibacillus macauensis ZFHKF-1]|uniref:Phosphatidic acid phosphatase type 2/haloperoxidase domain-containing protein n=1 Tax=Fictibacillus macauensis ZFHKF-1 TaxID=1196324 RepID=I8UD93_9BACL|nr:undecaprenyl-diphosphatase [Fictibacillus macauensis]EIT84783.1 hypothetical protein A374_13865 [Fictibacillus macauensis ZFHKF-1]
MNETLLKNIHGLAGQSDLLDQLMIFITDKAIYLFGLILLLMWVFGNVKTKKVALLAGITGVIGIVINVAISHIYFETRPFVTLGYKPLIDHAADASFPSDHTTGAFSIALILFAYRKKIGTFAIVLAVLTGFSRIYAGLHYPFDVLGSIVVSVILALIITKLDFLFEKPIQKIIDLYLSIFGKRSERRNQNM